ncbi:nitroreductase family deazaflavin-dependent oxidoreductase [Rhodococcoides fascians]|uniref:nitroreductase family deazaflavin-dependent oxidoreductase n=1 Tax=Rhodococcoides fascians TaxID=1828 RepID=UPI000562A3AF|nr:MULTISPECIES: nitroreductase family deazaflavin-dependent oxidoreductase [Rhodococcus]OZF01308.1 nitroreductase family deazaflavin-dependent oxidoreductase [Rhodococcus sp. 15-1189-1-1a]OZF15479.1 nitroreductase family deazaflavin-dependent oxidoreductase [Rhodococcus sp. 14-2686-1-2]
MALSGEYEPSPFTWSREQAEQYEASDGREAALFEGKPIVLVKTIGNKTGKLRKTPVMRVEYHGKYAMVASMGGSPKHPVWYFNVAANPRVELQDGNIVREYVAREVTGEAKAQWWARAVDAFPPYADYQASTDRDIPVFVLEAIA